MLVGTSPSPNPMSQDSTHEVTRLLQAWSAGQPQASEQLLPVIYEHLRRVAREYLSHERPGHTLQPTALVHEAYLRLADGAAVQWQGRAHFFSLAARAMRRILVDHARSRAAHKRGGEQQRLSLDAVPEDELARSPVVEETDLLSLDAALTKLAAAYPRQGRVVEMRFFGGVESAEIAAVLEVSETTVKRDWQFAKLWLYRELGHANAPLPD